MRSPSLRCLLILMIAGSTFTHCATAGILAYDVPSQSGNQMFDGSLGMDFDVNVGIRILELGVFDSSQDGLARPITAYLYNRDTELPLVTMLFASGATGTLVNGSRFLSLDSPIFLPAGFHGSIVAANYGPAEPNGNSSAPGWVLSTVNDGGGLISFVGTSRWGLEQDQFPTRADNRQPNMYGAGTFIYEAGTAVPEPATLLLCGVVVCLVLASKRLKRQAVSRS